MNSLSIVLSMRSVAVDDLLRVFISRRDLEASLCLVAQTCSPGKLVVSKNKAWVQCLGSNELCNNNFKHAECCWC